MSGDDDWFERALQEDGEADDAADATDQDADDVADQDADVADQDADGATAGGEGASTGGTDGSSPDGGAAGEGDVADGAPTDDEALDDGLFDEDFASALGGAGDSAGVPEEVEDAEFPVGGPDAGGDAGGFDDFAMGGEFGAGDAGGREFDEEVPDSDLDRIDVGIEGLDDMIQGGIPERSLMTVIGSAGTGKTTFGLQFVQHGLAADERAIYITLEESRERVIRSAEEKGWPFEAYVEDGDLAVVDMDPVEMANSLGSIRSELPRLIEEFGAARLVLDSVSLLELMYDDRATRRNEVYAFARSLKEAGLTTLVTSEASQDSPYASRHGIVEYLTDAVFVLQYVRPSDFRETRLAVEIQKIRDANHSREMKPFEITAAGINVYQQANIF